jgi:hypothetical protein
MKAKTIRQAESMVSSARAELESAQRLEAKALAAAATHPDAPYALERAERGDNPIGPIGAAECKRIRSEAEGPEDGRMDYGSGREERVNMAIAHRERLREIEDPVWVYSLREARERITQARDALEAATRELDAAWQQAADAAGLLDAEKAAVRDCEDAHKLASAAAKTAHDDALEADVDDRSFKGLEAAIRSERRASLRLEAAKRRLEVARVEAGKRHRVDVENEIAETARREELARLDAEARAIEQKRNALASRRTQIVTEGAST